MFRQGINLLTSTSPRNLICIMENDCSLVKLKKTLEFSEAFRAGGGGGTMASLFPVLQIILVTERLGSFIAGQ